MDSYGLPYQTPSSPIYRIGRKPDPWHPPDWAYVGDDLTFGNRFDDREGRFRVLYAASSPLGCFVETLAFARTPPEINELLAELDQIQNAPEEQVPFGRVPVSWLHKRAMGTGLCARHRFADVYSSQWLAYLRRRLQPGLLIQRPDLPSDFDLALLMSQERKLTQQIATIAYQLGYSGIHYQSRHGADLDNWALFEPFELEAMPSVDLTLADPALRSALSLLNLQLNPLL